MKHTRIALDHPNEWKHALEGINHSIAHTWDYCRTVQLTSGLNTYLYCFDSGDVRVVCPISERHFAGLTDITTPYGFSGFVGTSNCHDFPVHWREFVGQMNYVCGYIGLSPTFDDITYHGEDELYQHNSVYISNLALSFDEMWSMLSRNRKRQLRDWNQIKANLIFDKQAITEFLVTHHDQFMRSKGATEPAMLSRQSLELLCSLDGVLLVGAGESGRVKSAQAFGLTPFAADSLLNVSVEGARHYSAALLWHAMLQLKESGLPLLNLGGGVREGDSVAQFKQRFGAQRVALRALKQVYRRDKYEELCRLVDADAADKAGYFPPYRGESARWGLVGERGR
jgi:hypothetical protein